MTLLPEAAALLERIAARGTPALSELSVAAARHAALGFVDLQGEPEPVGSVRDLLVPGPAGRLPARVYAPAGEAGRPLLVYFHGGGWTWGDLEVADRPCRAIANATGCVVASVHYRLSPETSFPGPAEDAYAAICWLGEHAAELGADPARLVVGGDSAGGTLAAAVALMLRDRGGPAPLLQILVYPSTTAAPDGADALAVGDGVTLTAADMARYWDNYCPAAADRLEPYAAPLHASDVSGLPPALIVVAEHDVLRPEGVAYGERLRRAGVAATVHCMAGAVHGFLWMDGVMPTAGEAIALMAAAVAERVEA